MNSNSSSTIYDEAVGQEGSWRRLCDGCCMVPSVVYCHADSAYLCASCDVRIHSANRVASRHERVCLSVAHEHAPALLQCRTDAVASCAAYEAQAHYANLLAGMHQCVPVVSHPATAILADSLLAEAAVATTIRSCKEEEASWLLLSKNSANHNCSGDNRSSSTYFGEVDEYFDLVGYNSYYDSRMNNNRAQYVMQEQQHLQPMQKEYAEKEGSECVVPSQFATVSKPQQSGYALVGAEQAASMTAGVSVYTDSVNNSISFSSMEGGIVPDNTVVDLPHSIIPTPAGASSLHSGPPLQMPLHFSSMDREAKVLRYKEKKKTRTFEKTTRYATRKAYAEARPRIKGRFAKISEAEMEVDQMFSAAALSDSSYSTVPWF
uniref:Putative Hd1-like protein n=1 Tax=Festuca pratensis TaxID=4608 RepID=Q5CC41_FESPR|nr:putative Hd1-like protein [Festuca pratensis]